MYFREKKNKKWQKKFIKDVFKNGSKYNNNYSKIILDNLELLNTKNEYLPKYLFKYYATTTENILDIRNKRLWLSHPSQFNDPFDCNIGFDKDKYEKKCLLEYIKQEKTVTEKDKAHGFTIEDKNRILRSLSNEINYWSSKIESYFDAKREILDSKDKQFKQKIENYLFQKTKDLDNKVEKIKSIDIRISCFSNFNKYDEFYKQIVMWSHYADNHKGFCVEYDLSSLKEETNFSLKNYQFYDNKDVYLNERLKAIIKAGLFPVEYTANRVNIPVSLLKKINDLNSNIQRKNIEEHIYKAYVVKSANWNYEKEWRLIVNDQVSQYYGNKIPFPFAKKIYLGCKADNLLIDTMMAIGKEIGAEVTILKMDNKKFILEEKYSWESEYKYQRELRMIGNPYD